MASKNLKDLKGRLYAAFDEVMDVAAEDMATSTINNRTLAAQLLQAAAQMTRSIVEIEREEREAARGTSLKL